MEVGLNVAAGVRVIRRDEELVLSTRAERNGTALMMSDGFSIALDPIEIHTGVSYVPIASASLPTPLDRQLTGELWTVRVGAALTWPDGEDAGEVFRLFVHVGKLRKRDDRRCFELTLACGEQPGPQVCVSAEDISGGQPLDLNSTGLIDGS